MYDREFSTNDREFMLAPSARLAEFCGMSKGATPQRSELRFDSFSKAMIHLRDGVERVQLTHGELLTLEEEGLIQRFEYTFELAWKLLKDLALENDSDVKMGGPRPAIHWGIENGWIGRGEIWLSMLESRNITAHLYDRISVQSTLLKIRSSYLDALHEFETVVGNHQSNRSD